VVLNREAASRPDDSLERLLAERGGQLMRAAIALTGSRHEAEDLLQAALERLLRLRKRVEDPERYLRRTLYNLAADGWRRRGARRAKFRLLASPPNGFAIDPATTVDLRDALVRDLRMLAPRQRAVLVLRYWEQLSQAETAQLLGCSEGTVKSAASRGLQRLRELAASREAPAEGRS
jgi:RNA polymerase sigma-70 factor (sigma-E family)